MYEQFIEYYNENLPTKSSGQDIRIPSQKVYRDLFCNEYNLSFFSSKKDQCATYAARDHDTADNDNEHTQLFEEHMKQKNLTQNGTRKDKHASFTDDTYIMATFDMQSILQLPTSELGPVYYKRKLVFIINANSFCTILPSMRGKTKQRVLLFMARNCRQMRS